MIELENDNEPTRSCLTSRLRKVYYSYYDFETGKPHPVIRLGGKYLHKLGFNIGDAIEVNLQPSLITIRKASHSVLLRTSTVTKRKPNKPARPRASARR